MADKAGGILARLGTPAGASVSADMAAVKAAVDALSGGLSNQEKARIDLGFHQQAPLIETFRGFLDAPSTFVANNSITDAQIADQCARYSDAVAWVYRTNNATVPSITNTASNMALTLANSATSGKCSIVGALYPIRILPLCYLTFFPNDERFVWEAILTPNSLNDTYDHVTMFFGLLNTGVEDDWTSTVANFRTKTDVTARFGFCIPSDAGTQQMVGVCANGSNVSVTSRFNVDFDAPNHFKMVYDIGTGIEFFLNGVSQGTLSTYLPVSGSAYNTQYPYIPIFAVYTQNGYAGLMSIYGVRCYFQNGA